MSLFRTVIMTLCVFVLVGETHTAHAQCPTEEELFELIREGERNYVMRNFKDVKTGLTPVFTIENTEKPCRFDTEQVVEIRLLLGMSTFELGDQGTSGDHFLELLRIEPDYKIDPSIATLKIERHFEDVRTQNAPELDKIRKARKGTSSPDAEVRNIWMVAEDSVNHYWINFLPFGAGSFQNGDLGWGIFFAVSQGLSLGLNITGASMVEVIRGDSHTFTAAEAELARNWRVAQFVGLGLFGLFYIWGVVDGTYNFVERERVWRPPSDEPPAGLPSLDDDAEQGSSLEWKFIAPYATPDGGGISAGWVW